MFHIDHLEKVEIGRRLNLDRHAVRRLLAEAEQQRIIRYVIDSPDDPGDLEQRLLQRFPHLKRVIIVSGNPATEDGYLELLKAWGKAAAGYFDELVDGHQGQNLRVGISGGETLTHFANSVSDRLRRSVHVSALSLVARGPIRGSHVEPMINASILWFRSGRQPGHCQYVTISPYDIESIGQKRPHLVLEKVQTEMTRLAEMSAVEDHIRDLDDIDVAFASIATVEPPSSPLKTLPDRMRGLVISCLFPPTGLLRHHTAVDSVKAPVGDFCYYLIDEEGETRTEWSFFLSGGHYSGNRQRLSFFSDMVANGRIVIIIAGAYKEAAILAALRARLFNVWVTDEASAKYMLSR
jgi:DNA-binding transcriptional regulator LsrR (DeoR family)